MKSAFNRLEKSEAGFIENGHLLEEQLIGTIDSKKYKKDAYFYLHPEKFKNNELDKQAQYEKILMLQEEIESSFVTVMDFKRTRLPLKVAMKIIEKCQKNNPEAPQKTFARKLLAGVKNQFKDKYIFKFFTSSGGTHLDICNGIDGYFKIYNKETGIEMTEATIDLTSDPNKNCTPADLLIFISKEDAARLDDSRGNEKFDANFLEEVTASQKKRVVDALIQNFKTRNKINN